MWDRAGCLFCALGPLRLGAAYLRNSEKGCPLLWGWGLSSLPGKPVILRPPTEQPKVSGKWLYSELGPGVGCLLAG